MKASLAILVLLCLGLSGPPLPTVPKRPHKSAAVHQGAGAQKLIAKAPLVAAAPSIRLDWDFDGDPKGIVFNVRSYHGPLVAPTTSWPIVATVTSNACILALDKAEGMVCFSVTSSNTATGLDSGFSSQ